MWWWKVVHLLFSASFVRSVLLTQESQPRPAGRKHWQCVAERSENTNFFGGSELQRWASQAGLTHATGKNHGDFENWLTLSLLSLRSPLLQTTVIFSKTLQ